MSWSIHGQWLVYEKSMVHGWNPMLIGWTSFKLLVWSFGTTIFLPLLAVTFAAFLLWIPAGTIVREQPISIIQCNATGTSSICQSHHATPSIPQHFISQSQKSRVATHPLNWNFAVSVGFVELSPISRAFTIQSASPSACSVVNLAVPGWEAWESSVWAGEILCQDGFFHDLFQLGSTILAASNLWLGYGSSS